MTTPTPQPNAQVLLQQAQLLAQANRYGLLRRQSDNKLVQKIAKL